MSTDHEPRFRVLIDTAGGWDGDGCYHPARTTAGHPVSRDEALATFDNLINRPAGLAGLDTNSRVLVLNEDDYQKRAIR